VKTLFSSLPKAGAQPGVPSARDFSFARDGVEVLVLERSALKKQKMFLKQTLKTLPVMGKLVTW